jgi:uncharacterized phage-associated protein
LCYIVGVPYDARSVANYFIDSAAGEGKRLTPLQLIKFVYLAHGWHLGIRGEPLLNERAEAWQYGPVIPSLYHALKVYGNRPVTEKLASFEVSSGPTIVFTTREIPTPDDPAVREVLAAVWNAYKHFTGAQLTALTHQAGTPWYQTWENEGGKQAKGTDIRDDLIREHFQSLWQKRNDARAATPPAAK